MIKIGSLRYTDFKKLDVTILWSIAKVLVHNEQLGIRIKMIEWFANKDTFFPVVVKNKDLAWAK